MKTYPDMKDSEVEWIGEIPGHWTIIPLKRVVKSIISGGTPSTDEPRFWSEDGIPWVSISDMTENGRVIMKTKKTISEEGRQSKGLTVLPINSISLSIYGSIGKVSVTGIPCVTHQGILGITPDETMIRRDFLVFLLGGLDDFISIESSVNTQGNLNLEKVKRIPILLPPKSEQEQIVSFLNDRTSLIDRTIEIKSRRIELLKEMKSSLISEVVTKGLDSDVPMRDSGVEWIGKIPTHWTKVRLKYLLRHGDGLQTGPFGGMITPEKMTPDGIKVFGQINVLRQDFTLGYRYVSEESFNETLSRYEVVPGDLVLTRKGSVGQICLVPRGIPTGILDSDLIRLRPNEERIENRFLVRVFSGSRYVNSQMTRSTRGSVVGGVNSEVIGEISIVLPPLPEQEEIMTFLDEKTLLIDEEISREEKLIVYLNEVHQSLIHEVVTGKMDVRGGPLS